MGENDSKAGRRLRVITCGLFFATLSLVLLMVRYLRTGLEPFGVYGGIPAGVVMGIWYLAIWFRYVTKGKFVVQCESPGKFWVQFLVIVIILGSVLSALLIHITNRFPGVQALGLLGTFLLVGLTVFIVIATLGVYWLEHRYGKKLYVGGRNTSLKDKKPKDEQDNK